MALCCIGVFVFLLRKGYNLYDNKKIGDLLVGILIIYLVTINLIGLIIMFTDKRRAVKRQYRIAEGTLWTVAVLGGAIGTTIGMYLFRHKTKKGFLKVGFTLLAIIQIVIVYFFNDEIISIVKANSIDN